MEIFLDTADAAKIEKYCQEYPIAGFTCNPTIVTTSDKSVAELAKLVPGKKVFIQAISETCEGIIEDSKKLKSMREDIYIKIPCTPEGYKAMYQLKKMGFNILATAVYSVGQAIFAGSCGADYVAPYVNRMSDTEIDGCSLVENIINAYSAQGIKTKIVAASFKNLNQIVRLLTYGIDAVTIPTSLFEKLISNKLANDAVDVFTDQWEAKFNKRSI